MRLLRDVICRIDGKGQGCPLISATYVDYNGVIYQAKGRGGGGGGTQNVTQNTAPWAGQQPYLSHGFGQAQAQQGTPQTFFPGQTYANFSPQTEQALNLTEQRALAGSPVQRAGNKQLTDTLNGNYLYGGEGFNAALDAAKRRILPQIDSQFAQGGRYGSGAHKAALTQTLGDSFASQYGQERENQLRSMLFAPQAAQADYQDLNALAGVGSQREGQAQSGIDEAMERHNFQQMEPAERLARYMAMIQGNYGSSMSQQNQPFRGNRGAGVLGGALGGAGIGSAFGPIGAGIGGLVGGLGGLF